MGTVRYTTINGEVIAEKRSGVRRLYVPDPLGSTVALLDNTQTQVDTATYWPYGEVRTFTGTTPVPFQFAGTKGYYSDGYSTEAVGRTYVRARYLHTQKGRWLTQDPIGFDGDDFNLYRYVHNCPVTVTDPTGLFQLYGCYCGPGWPPPNENPDPIDELDTCCQIHDECYTKIGNSGTTWALCQALLRSRTWLPIPQVCKDIAACDHALCKCASGANCHNKVGCNSARAAILLWMCTV